MASKKKIKVLILGSSGQLGSKLSSLKNHKKLILYTPSKKNLDIRNYNSIKKYLDQNRPNVIINCAAYTKVDRAIIDYSNTFKLNIEGVSNLCQSLFNRDILLIHFSTDYVFDGRKKTLYTELDKTNPISYYGFSKNIGDSLIKYHLKKYIIFRISWLYSSEKDNFLNKFIKLLELNKNMSLISDNIGRPTSVNNVYLLIKKILLSKNYMKRYGVYHLSDSGRSVSWYDLVLFISNSLNINKIDNIKKCKYSQFKFIESRPKNSLFSLLKIKKSFNFKPNSWTNELNQILNEFRK